MITDNARHENVPKAQLYKMPESESRTQNFWQKLAFSEIYYFKNKKW